MRRRLIFPLLLGLAGCAVLVALGLWQLQRMEWKAGILARIEARIGAPPVPLPEAPTEAADEYLPVTVAGRLTGDFVELLSGQRGGSPGVRIIAALETAGGRKVLVDRGFLPDEARATPRPAKAITVTGNLLWPQDADSFTPPPDAKTGLWFARDLPAMAATLGTEPLLIVARAPTGDGIVPVPVDGSGIPNDHWAYAIQWFLLAIVWGVMTLFLLSRIRRQNA